MGAPGLVSPDSFPFRHPTDASMRNGRTENRPRYLEAGGAHTPRIWFREGGNHAQAQMAQANVARVTKPTSTKSAKKSARQND
jgi:hypothetical protein